MAPIPADSDLLDAALKSRTVLPSWRSTFAQLTSPSRLSPATATRISNFLLAPSSLNALANCYDAFPAPSAASKQDFEKRTAAINFTAADQPNGNGPTDADTLGALPGINELKTEALDLSKTLNIDEVSALRIVVVEYQSRPARALLAAAPGDGTENLFGGMAEESLLGKSVALSDETKKDMVFFDRVGTYLNERRYVIKVATLLLRTSVTMDKNASWAEVANRFVVEGIIERGGAVEKIVQSIEKRWDQDKRNYQGPPEWVKSRMEGEDGEAVVFAWEKQTMLEIVHLLQLLFLQLYRPVEEISGSLVIKWFGLMKDTRFLSERKTRWSANIPEIANLANYVGGLTSILSLTILHMPKVEKYLQEEVAKSSTPDSSATPPAHPPSPPRNKSEKDFYITHAEAIEVVTSCLKENSHMVGAGPAGMGWVIILDFLRIALSANTDYGNDISGPSIRVPSLEMYESALPRLFSTTVEIGIKNLAAATAPNMLMTTGLLLEPSEAAAGTSQGIGFYLGCEEDGFRMKNVFAHLIRRSQIYLEMSPQFVAAAFLTTDVEYEELPEFKEFMAQEKQLVDDKEDGNTSWTGSPVARAWADPEGLTLLERAKNRFPYEPLPFLQILRGLATEGALIVDYLARVKSFTMQLPQGFRDYDNEDDDSEVTTVNLLRDLSLFSARGTGIFDNDGYGYGSGGEIFIPRGTLGVVTSTGGSRPVVAWNFEYNAFTLFGRVLEFSLLGTGPESGQTIIEQLAEPEVITEIVNVLTMILASKGASGTQASVFDLQQVLEDGSDVVGRSRDIVSIIFDLLENSLQTTQGTLYGNTRRNKGSTLQFAIASIKFVDALVSIMPGRVWPYLSRSGLLERNGRGGAFMGILTAVETVSSYYEFTLSCLSLYEHLVDEAVASSVVNRGGSRSVIPASKAPTSKSAGAGVSDFVQRDILLGWTRNMVDIFESYRGWRYKNTGQKLEIGTRISRIFTTILDYVFGVDETSDLDTKITSVLSPSAEHLVKVFLSGGTNDLALAPIVGAVADAVNTPESSLYLKTMNAWVQQAVNIIVLADKLVRVRTYTRLRPSPLEQRLFTISSDVAKMYAVNDRYRRPALELLEALVLAAESYPDGPPSLLGHLGTHCANHFVALLKYLDKPFDDITLEARIWSFASAVVSHKQQGMSILLLRGAALRKGKSTMTDSAPKKSLLSICLDALEDIERLEPERSLAMLDMVSAAQNFWSVAMEDLSRHPKFLSALIKHAENLKLEFLPADSKDMVTDKAHRVAVAAYVAQILALYLHSRRPSERDEGFFKQLLPKLDFYFEKAVKITGYRVSLHSHLKKNFEEKWPGLKLAQLRKTKLRRKEYGRDAVYDMRVAGKILGFDPSWNGRADGYAAEVEQANLNLSMIQTQVDLLTSWQMLAVELCTFVKNSPELAKSMATVVESCLSENIDTAIPAPIFTQIVSSRAEFAFVVVRKLHEALPDSPELFDGIFTQAWRAIGSSATDFHRALLAADMQYYRPLLRVIYIALVAIGRRPKQTVEMASQVQDLLTVVVAQGFKHLAQAAHALPEEANPQDIALITAILQASLRLKGVEGIYTHLGTHLAENGTIRAATTLFSWAEELAGSSNDPVYGELSVLFLLELSAIPTLADLLAQEGVLELLTSSTLGQRIREGVSITSDPRRHAIWSQGMLPIALNLLGTIGQRISREIIEFLKFYAPQINQAIEEMRTKPKVMNLPMINEATTIVIIMIIIYRYGEPATLEGLNFDRQALVEGVDYSLTHKNYLKSLIVATSAEEDEMERKETEGEGGNELADKVLAGLVALQNLLGDDEMEE